MWGYPLFKNVRKCTRAKTPLLDAVGETHVKDISEEDTLFRVN